MALQRGGALVAFEDARSETRRIFVKFAGRSPKFQGRETVLVHDVRVGGTSDWGGLCDKGGSVVGDKPLLRRCCLGGKNEKTGDACRGRDGTGTGYEKDSRTNSMLSSGQDGENPNQWMKEREISAGTD